jgi:hypothetical protein
MAVKFKNKNVMMAARSGAFCKGNTMQSTYPKKRYGFSAFNRFHFAVVAGYHGCRHSAGDRADNRISQGYTIRGFKPSGFPYIGAGKRGNNFYRRIIKTIQKHIGILTTFYIYPVILHLKRLDAAYVKADRPLFGPGKKVRYHAGPRLIVKKRNQGAGVKEIPYQLPPLCRGAFPSSISLSARLRSKYAAIVSSPLQEPRKSSRETALFSRANSGVMITSSRALPGGTA